MANGEDSVISNDAALASEYLGVIMAMHFAPIDSPEHNYPVEDVLRMIAVCIGNVEIPAGGMEAIKTALVRVGVIMSGVYDAQGIPWYADELVGIREEVMIENQRIGLFDLVRRFSAPYYTAVAQNNAQQGTAAAAKYIAFARCVMQKLGQDPNDFLYSSNKIPNPPQ